MKKALLLLISLIYTGAGTATDVYRTVRPDGTVEYSDEPRPGAERIKIPEVQLYSPPPLPAPVSLPAEEPQAEEKAITYKSIAIASPANEETVFHNTGGMVVSIVVSPTLAPDHEIVVTLDGKQAGRGHYTSFVLQGVERGTHTLEATIKDKDGNTLMSSTPITFFMRQHSRIKRAVPQ